MAVILDLRPRLRAARCRRALKDLRAISLRLAEKFVRETEMEITRQRVMLHDRRATGRQIGEAEQGLLLLEDLLRERKAYLARLQREGLPDLAAGDPTPVVKLREGWD
jgi:hypothetical protein